ncbi:MAG: HDOD domain-containing protein [Verrucomicrobiota bacterium]
MSTLSTVSSRSVTAFSLAQSLRYPPSAAKVLPLLKRLLGNLDTSIHQIADVVRLDPGIAARVLHAANSVMYCRGERCTSVAMAVNRIGFDNIYAMVSDAVAEQVLVLPLNAYSLEADEFWQRSVACAIAAERIAELCELDRNVAYTLGLLSGIGMVAIEHWARANQPSLAFFNRGVPRDHSDSENVLLGCTNAEVGAIVLQSWEFPPEMSAPVRWQYRPLESSDHRRLSLMLHCAKSVSHRACADSGARPVSPDDRVVASLRLRPSLLENVVAHVRSRLNDVERQLRAEPNEAA